MNTTKILGEAVGIQSQGIVDKTETQTNEGLTSALIVGRFKRGRIDKPMTIHQGNIRGQLGYEPTNIDYQAVQDCLDTGVLSVQVLRVGGMIVDPEVPHIISCEGATTLMSFSHIAGDWDIYIDDMATPVASGTIGVIVGQISLAFQNQITADYDGFLYIENIDTVPHRFKFVPKPNSNASFTANVEQNPTFLEHDDGSLTFCLAQAVEECSPTDVDFPNTMFTGNKSIEYSLNDGVFRTVSCSGNGWNMSNLFNAINNDHGQRIVLIGWGNYAAFQLIELVNHLRLMGVDENGTQPTTLTIRDIGNNVISTIFGSNSVTFHSCGFKQYPGI